MTALLFDTLRLSRTLRDKGHFTAEQAEALAEALGEATQGDLATKADLAAVRTEVAELKTELETETAGVRAEIADVRTEIAGLRTELKTEIAGFRTELKTEFAGLRTELKTENAETKTDLLKWIIGSKSWQSSLFGCRPSLLICVPQASQHPTLAE
jgi:ribosomal protein L29